jgi:integrase
MPNTSSGPSHSSSNSSPNAQTPTQPQTQTPSPLVPKNQYNNSHQRAHKIIEEGTSLNSRLAMKADLKYFWLWAKLSHDLDSQYPVSLSLLLQFITDHLKGLPDSTEEMMMRLGHKKKKGPHNLSTVLRRVSSLSSIHKLLNVPNPCVHPKIRMLLQKAAKTPDRPAAVRKKGITSAILKNLNESLDAENSLKSWRDKALIGVGISSGGRRRSELSNINFEHLEKIPDGYKLFIPRSKGDQTGKGGYRPIKGLAAQSLEKWLEASAIGSGPIFRSISKSGKVLDRRLNPKSISDILKLRLEKIGYNPKDFAGHSLRRGFATECGRKGIDGLTTMRLMGLKSPAMLNVYREEGDVLSNDLHEKIFVDID